MLCSCIDLQEVIAWHTACPALPVELALLMLCYTEQVLLFSTMTGALDVLASFLTWRGFQHLQLDGRTKPAERGTIVHQFNTTGQLGQQQMAMTVRHASQQHHVLTLAAFNTQGCSFSC